MTYIDAPTDSERSARRPPSRGRNGLVSRILLTKAGPAPMWILPVLAPDAAMTSDSDHRAQLRGSETEAADPEPLGAVNESFHDSYDATRSELALAVPTLVATVDALYLCHGKERRRFAIAHGEFHSIKAAAHAPVAVYASLVCAGEGRLDPAIGERLARLRSATGTALDRLGGREDAMAIEMRNALHRTLSFIAHVLDRGAVERSSLDAFAAGCGPLLERLTEHGTRAQLASLDLAIENAMATTTADERRDLHVVVTGDHQARVRSLAMQYFQKRLAERPGDDSRVTFGEGVTSVDEALTLVATCNVDRKVAAAFFGDPKRLQRDVLGDAAATLLAATPLGLINEPAAVTA